MRALGLGSAVRIEQPTAARSSVARDRFPAQLLVHLDQPQPRSHNRCALCPHPPRWWRGQRCPRHLAVRCPRTAGRIPHLGADPPVRGDGSRGPETALRTQLAARHPPRLCGDLPAPPRRWSARQLSEPPRQPDAAGTLRRQDPQLPLGKCAAHSYARMSLTALAEAGLRHLP